MSAREHLQPRLFDPGPEPLPEDRDRVQQARVGRELANFGEVAISMPPAPAESVAVTGAIMTQYETGDSQGAYSPSLRQEVETAMGYEDEPPVYGYFSRGPNESPPYGRVDFRLKSSVKDRTYMHSGDSLNRYGSSKFTGDSAPETMDARSVAEGYAELPVDQADIEYVEAHILPDHRPETVGMGDGVYPARVPLSDVHRVDIHDRSTRFDPSGEARLAQRSRNFDLGRDLERAGVPVDHVLADLTEQPSLPMQYNDGPQPSAKFGTRKRVVRHEDMQGRDRWGSD